jgi:hypothetical protein
MSQVQLAANGIGGTVQGAYGTYGIASDSTFTVDTRDAAAMLALGMTYITKNNKSFTLPAAPLVATTGKIVASVALSNGGLTIANQPDVMRPASVIVGTGTSAISAGSLAMTYTANDGTVTTDTFSLATPASANVTQLTSKGMVKVATAIVSGLAGGTSPFIYVNTIAALSVPVDPGAVDFSVYSETADGAQETVGTLSTALGSIAPTTVANGTHTFSFGYTYNAPSA